MRSKRNEEEELETKLVSIPLPPEGTKNETPRFEKWKLYKVLGPCFCGVLLVFGFGWVLSMGQQEEGGADFEAAAKEQVIDKSPSSTEPKTGNSANIEKDHLAENQSSTIAGNVESQSAEVEMPATSKVQDSIKAIEHEELVVSKETQPDLPEPANESSKGAGAKKEAVTEMKPKKTGVVTTSVKPSIEPPVGENTKLVGKLQPNGLYRSEDTPAFKFFEAHCTEAPQGARGVLVLLTDPRNPKLSIKQPAMTKFAENEKLAIVSIGFQLQPQLRNSLAIYEEFSKLIDQAVVAKYGDGRKKVGFAQGGAAQWFMGALHANPEGWIFWGVKGCPAFPKVGKNLKDKKFPPGVVMSVEPEHYVISRDYFKALRALDPAKQKVTFVGSNKQMLEGAFLDRFFRQYVSSVYAGKVAAGGGLWFNITDSEGSPQEGKPPWIEHSWVPNEEIAGAWRILNQERPRPPARVVDEVEFEIAGGDKQKLWIRTPGKLLDEKNNAKARTVMLYMTRRKEDKFAKEVAMGGGNQLTQWADENRVPLVVWNGLSVWPHDLHQKAEKSTDGQRNTANQKFIKIGDAMVGKLREVCRERGWPDQKWFLTADTCMGDYGLMMAQAYPFAAVHLHSASGYEAILESPKVPWLVTTGWAAPCVQENTKFSGKARTENWPVLFKRFPKLGHGSRGDLRVLTAEFFKHVVWLQDGGGKTYGWANDWAKPALPDKYRPVQPEKEGEPVIQPTFPPDFNRGDFAPLREKPQTVGEWFSEECQRVYLAGDWRTLKLSELSQQKWIPSWRHVKLPTRELAEAWALTESAPPELSEKDIEEEKKHQARITARENGEEIDQKSDPKSEEADQ